MALKENERWDPPVPGAEVDRLAKALFRRLFKKKQYPLPKPEGRQFFLADEDMVALVKAIMDDPVLSDAASAKPKPKGGHTLWVAFGKWINGKTYRRIKGRLDAGEPTHNPPGRPRGSKNGCRAVTMIPEDMEAPGAELLAPEQAGLMFGGKGQNRKTEPATVVRWMKEGAKDRRGRIVVLEHVEINRRLYTTRPAVARWLAELAAG